MADVGSTLASWSSTDASNSPSGATTIGTGLDDNLRAIQAVVVRGLSHKGSDIASATTTDIGAVEGLMHDITGTTTITGLGTVRAGILKVLKFEGALTFTHNGTSLILPGAANITTANGDVAIMISEGSGNWRCLHYMKADGSHLGPVLATEQATTSGTSIDFTSIPSWVKKITIQFVGVSTNGTSEWQIRIGDGGGIEDSGYLGCGSVISSASVSASNYTAGFGINNASAASVLHGTVTLTLEDSSAFTWVAAGILAASNTNNVFYTGGSKSLSAALDRVRITTVNGTDAFDDGAINVMYE